MKKRKVYKIILIALLIIEIPIMYLTFKTFSNKDITKVSYNENIKSKSTLAYYIDGELQEGMTSWPTDKEYEKAECYYGNHVEVPAEEVLSFDNSSHTATITSNKTIYCSLFFGKTPGGTGTVQNAVEFIDQNSAGFTLETEEELDARNKTISGNVKDDLRRFVGDYRTVTDNFICFGVENQQTCKDNMDLYMYRIIGIDIEGRLKIIKATKLVQGSTSGFQWYNSYTSNITWPDAYLYKRLNGTSTDTYNYPNIFIGNSKYSYMQDETWTKLISPTTYYIGDSTSSSNPTLFQNERTKSIENAKIGLMYLSDYLYAGNNDTSNWLFIQNGLKGKDNTPSGSITPTAVAEWTMTRYGYVSSNSRYRARYVYYTGGASGGILTEPFAVRPVFYLESGVSIGVGGEGTFGNPYIIFIL